ncbi:MAG: lysophospholipid acyltransferase family protein, partial [Burkholderiaceae bacterium]
GPPFHHPRPALDGGQIGALRRGEAIGVLPDQVPSQGEGTWVPFFNRLAYTMTLPERLARLTGAVVLMGHAERLQHGQGWQMRIEPLETDPTPLEVNRAMEKIIRRLPEQYFWGYNRYKAPPGVSHPVREDA